MLKNGVSNKHIYSIAPVLFQAFMSYQYNNLFGRWHFFKSFIYLFIFFVVKAEV